MTWWRSFLTHDPEPNEVVLVQSEGWAFPKVLRYVPIGGRHRLYEMGQDLFYYYPERMHWMPLPAPPLDNPPSVDKP